MKWTKATEPAKGNHADTLIVRFKGKKRVIENRYGEYWVWQTDHDKEIRVYDNQWAELEYLDESIPASAEDEAARMYPYDYENYDAEDHADVKIVREAQRLAHIRCAGMYTDTIDKLKAENSKMRTTLLKIEGIARRYGNTGTDPEKDIELTEKLATEALKNQ